MRLKFLLLLIFFTTPCFSGDINSKKCFDELYSDRAKILDELDKKQMQRVERREPFEELIVQQRRYIEKMCKQYVYCESLETAERDSELTPFMKSTIFESCIIGEHNRT